MIGPTQEVHDEAVGRMVKHFLRAAHLLDLTLVQDDDLIGHGEGFFLVVGDEDAGDMKLIVQSAQPGTQLFADLRVQGAERLVEQ